MSETPSRSLAVFGASDGPWHRFRRCLILAPHPDDFEVVAVTLRQLAHAGTELHLEVLTSGASGVEDRFVTGWKRKAAVREAEQRRSCTLFGLPAERLRFHRLEEDCKGHMAEHAKNETTVRSILDRVAADAVILPHGNDTNADHRRTFRIFDRWAQEQTHQQHAMLVRDPKSIGMTLDLITPFGYEEAAWKATLLRCHASQQERNLRTRGHGLDERILRVNRDIATQAGIRERYAEGFQIATYQTDAPWQGAQTNPTL